MDTISSHGSVAQAQRERSPLQVQLPDRIGRVNTVTLHNPTAFAKLCDAAQHASVVHSNTLAAAGATSTLRRHLGLKPERPPQTREQHEAAVVKEAAKAALQRKWKRIQQKHDAYKRIQSAGGRKRNKDQDEVHLRVRVNKLLVGAFLARLSFACAAVNWPLPHTG